MTWILGLFTKNWKLVLGVVGIGLLALGLKITVDRYNKAIEQVGSLTVELENAEAAIQEEKQNHISTKKYFEIYIQEMEQRTEIINANLALLQQTETKAQEKIDELQRKLQKHDLAFLALKKPGLVGNRINAATNSVFRSIEERTRAFSTKSTDPE